MTAGDGAGNAVRRALAAGRPALGGWCSLGSAVACENMARAGFEWLVLDAQHGAPGLTDLAPLIRAIELGGADALVRVPWNDPATLMRTLDLGARGVIVPMVSTVEEARAAGVAVRYPPRGMRSYGPLRDHYGSIDGANDDVVCLVMVETAEGLAAVEQIAAAPGVDGIFLGPVDLAVSLGLGLDLTLSRPETVEAMTRVVAACEAAGVIAGTLAFNVDQARRWLDLGFRFVSVGGDAGYVRRGATGDVAGIRELAAGAG